MVNIHVHGFVYTCTCTCTVLLARDSKHVMIKLRKGEGEGRRGREGEEWYTDATYTTFIYMYCNKCTCTMYVDKELKRKFKTTDNQFPDVIPSTITTYTYMCINIDYFL